MLALWVLLAAAATAAPEVLDAPVTSATVFSDCARVTRTASLSLSGRSLVSFPVLPARAVASSIRLEATGAEVEHITVRPVKEDELPVDEARALLAAIEQLDRQIELANAERSTLAEMHVALGALTPTYPEDSQRPPPHLDPSGWLAAMSFLTGSTEALQARLATAERRLAELREQQRPLVEKAHLLGAQHATGGHHVLATVSGKGTARLDLTYEVSGARWYPTYDVQLAPAKGQVAIAFVGLVEQETGEDWENTRLTLSTAIPSHSSKLPKLTAWRIGTSERFEPRPTPEPTAVPPPPRPSPTPPGAVDEVERVRRLLALAGTRQAEAPTGAPEAAPAAPKPSGVMKAKSRFHPVTVDDLAARPDSAREMAKAPKALHMERVDFDVEGGAEEVDYLPDKRHEKARRTVYSDEDALESIKTRQVSSVRSRPAPRLAVNIAPPAAYRYPQLASNLPAALAGGHDLAFPAVARESVASGKGARRVALFSQVWPVSVERLVFPALAKEAYLVAEIKNPSKQPLPGGRAQLFVGEDPAGVATLKLVAPGETFTLPLGVDQAIKPIRNVTQSTVESGLISKDETTEYVTVIELSNPHASPLAVRVKDQMPKTADKSRVEIKLLGSEPAAKLNTETGELEWRTTLAPGATAKLRFVYSIKRPKGARLVQR